jgi:aspartyl aminopeptidase
LLGSTKVSLPGYTAPGGAFVAVNPDDDMFMMAQEVETLLRGVAAWARNYKPEWHIRFDGSLVGSVSNTGVYSPDLLAFLSELHTAAATPADPEEVKRRVSRLRTMYASRSGDA